MTARHQASGIGKWSTAAFGCVVLLVTAGCSGLQWRGDWAPRFTADAARATSILSQEDLPAAEARTYIAEASGLMTAYREALTVNPFAFLFGDKTLLATLAIYDSIRLMSLDAEELARRAPDRPDNLVVRWAAIMARQVILVNSYRLGKEPPN